MTPETRDRFAVLVERRLADLSGPAETDELSTLLEGSEEARELYLRAVDFHLDLGARPRKEVAVRPIPAAQSRFGPLHLAAAVLLVAGLFGLWVLTGSDSTPNEEQISRIEAAPQPLSVAPRSSPPPPPPPPTEPPPAPPSEMVAIPADLLRDISQSFKALPPGYRSTLATTDQKRLEEITKTGRGSEEDIEWLRIRILHERIPAFQREAELIQENVLALEPKLKANAATDVIIRRNGTKVEGQIVSQTDDVVKLKTRFGTVAIPMSEVAKIEKGKGSATEFPQRWLDAKGDLDKLGALLAWCQEKNLKLEKEYVAYSILTLDASHARARAAVNLGPK